MKLRDTFSYFLANWINGGGFATQNQLAATDIQVDYNTIFTHDCVKKIVRIAGIAPIQSDIGFIDYIRDKMFEQHPNVELIISETSTPVNLKVDSDKFERASAKAGEQYESYRAVFDSQDKMHQLMGKRFRLPGGGSIKITSQTLFNRYQQYLSYTTVYSSVTDGGSANLTNIFIEVCGKDLRTVKKACHSLVHLLRSLQIYGTELKGVCKNYLSSYGPATSIASKPHKKFLPPLLFTDDNYAAFTPYRSRGVLSEKGILMGTDFRSRSPFLLDFFSAPAAQVIVLMGKTGSGKTFAAFMSALSALANGKYVSAIDIKGREWSLLSAHVDAKIITLDAKHPRFVNTLRLDDVVVRDATDAHELFNTAVQGTVSLLSLMVNLGPTEGNQNDLSLILREAVLKMYSQEGVSPDNVESFQRTATFKFPAILDYIEQLSRTKTYTQQQREMAALARSRCYSFIGEGGILSAGFRNEITLSEVLDAPFGSYEFNKNQGAMTDQIDVIRIFMVQFLDSKKMAMLKQRDKFLFCYYEELQRCDQFGNLLEYISGVVTGARSNNAVVFLLLNSLSVLLNPRSQSIRSNITTFISGIVSSDDTKLLATEFGQPWVAHQTALFDEKKNVYRHCFACSADTGVDVLETVYRVDLPPQISDGLRTRSIEVDE